MIPVAYVHDSTNGGLVPGYNQGIRLAKDNGADWLLLLDQDTVLTAATLKHFSLPFMNMAKMLESLHIQLASSFVGNAWRRVGSQWGFAVT